MKRAKRRPLKPGVPDTRSRVRKGPARSNAHLDLVRSQQCLVTRSYMGVVAHHPRELLPELKTAGRRVSDFLAVPLREDAHAGYPHSLHTMNSAQWWRERRINPFPWLKIFLIRHYDPAANPDVAKALEIIANRERLDREADLQAGQIS